MIRATTAARLIAREREQSKQYPLSGGQDDTLTAMRESVIGTK